MVFSIEYSSRYNMEVNSDYLEPVCDYCSAQTFEPYIECLECENVNLCTSCFATGVEFGYHKSDHDYSICRNDFPVFENSDWPAKDEYLLLQAILKCGYGNWDGISKTMQKYSESQCKQHYEQFYIDNTQCEELPKLTTWTVLKSDIPYIYKEYNSEDLPRNPNSDLCKTLAGYNAYRSEFEINFDNGAEQLLQFENIENDEDEELTQSLQCAVVQAYNNRLRERHRRYKIIREHGLLLFRKFSIWLMQYEETLGKNACEQLSGFMQLLTGLQFDTLMESLHREKEIRLHLYKLYDLRRNGITTNNGWEVYEILKKRREDHMRELKSIRSWDWKVLSENNSYNASLLHNEYANKSNRRRILPPLEIINLPDYEKLKESEREFCSKVRLPPANFLQFKELLILENDKSGFVRLCDARKLIKIDVNKTRKLYDYMLNENLIQKSS